MSLSLDSIGNNRLGVASEKLLKKELENKFSENASSVENELKGDAVTISEKGRVLAKKISSLSLDPINESEIASIKLLIKEVENKLSKNASSVGNELKVDAVTISEKGRALAKKITSLEESDEQAGKTAKQVKKERASESGGNKSALDKLIETLKKKIKVVEQEIQSLKGSKMPDETKQSMLSAKTEELTLLNGQLQSAMAQKMKAAQGAAKA